ncbi:hypothetical protein CTEN210_12786 [Chaetoceros tenuissimus]|uniref:RING-type domain-containing protein n=1 Tax=Chaetoceros tenuissimus TaxID=426638 RepID=A0AAD3D417_9STRA|nr:hypothetical protein CTEN210_12786 [Chaetoceros tenuissimus]
MVQNSLFFDDDPSKPMKCEVKGSKWNKEMYMGLPDNRKPYYVVLINGEISQIPFTDAHDEGGWQVGWDRKGPVEQKDEEGDEFPRKCIMCSNPQCVKTNPKICCLCKIAYYCSHGCKIDVMDEHVFYCRTAEDMRKITMRTYGSQRLDPSEIPLLVCVDCKICNKDTKERHPHCFKKCGHVYCHECLESWYEIKEQGCPFCRAERSKLSPISKYEKDIFFLAHFYAAKANARPKGSIERHMLCDQALDYISRLIGRELTNFSKAEISLSMGKILNLHGREMHRTMSLVLARSEFSEGSYNEKIKSYLQRLKVTMEIGKKHWIYTTILT